MAVRPLVHRGKDGQVLTRSDVVEAQIADVLTLDPLELRRRLTIRRDDEAGYIKEETLVHLLREYHRRGDGEVDNAVAEVLLRRCTPQAKKYLRSLGDQQFEIAHADLSSQLFEKILDANEGRGDFLEVRFGRAFKNLARDVFRSHRKDTDDARSRLVPLSSLAGYDGDDDRRTADSDTARQPVVPENRVVLANEALNEIPKPERIAYLLYEYGKWQIESKDPHTPTISKYFQRNPRTIRNWLKTAENALEKWRGGEP